jgi:sec-independent protein translocase protein TatC
MILGFGLAFELPLAMVMLSLAGVLTHERFRKWRRMIIFLVFVFAGIASPSPDPLTMLLLAVPCVVLVEVAEIVIWATDRRRASRPSPYAGLSDDEVSPLDFDARAPEDADLGRSPGTDA